MNQENNLELLCDYLSGPFKTCLAMAFMQDVVQYHTAKSVRQNLTENLWIIIQQELHSHDSSTVLKLQAVLYHIWKSCIQQHLMVLADNLTACLDECKKHKGNHTKYLLR